MLCNSKLTLYYTCEGRLTNIGRYCCTVVEQTLNDQSVAGSNLACYWAFLSFYPLSDASFNRFRTKVTDPLTTSKSNM